MAKQKKGGGGKLSRSETVTVRLDPKLRFAAELAARKHRRTLSSFIEWAVEEAAKKVSIKYHYGSLDDSIEPWDEYAIEAIENAWDVDEADRFAKLALNYPALLTHDEEVLWKLICECGFLWRGQYEEKPLRNVQVWTWVVCLQSINFERLRENWENLKSVADGTSNKDILPSCQIEKPMDMTS